MLPRMPYEQGLTDWRVYSAEQAVGADEQLDVAQAQRLIDEAAAAPWWRTWFPHAPAVAVVEGGQLHPEQGLISSFAYPDRHPMPEKWTISLHPEMTSTRVVLHELAHCLAPSLYSTGEKFGCGTPYPPSRHRHHGPYFAATLQVITDQVFGHRDAGELAGALRHFEAPTAELEDLRAELAKQPALHKELQEMYDESRRSYEARRTAYVDRHGEEPPEPWIPPWHWGFNLRMRRRDYHRSAGGRLLSQKRLAEIVSVVHPCTVRHIAKLEDSAARPDDPGQLKRAMTVAIHLGFDPIWARYVLRLTRWDCGDVTLEEARILNPAWADLVEHMNELVQQMPPRWYVEGAR
ncbi:hypothetical protein A5742_17390 [Mycolicibacterium fortuitum]|uniref:IrrE N-terminal-like domain-containing protein n=1 Tax=Mycolicibacterium fortuitum TaxID=1766 RepID=A0ABD6QUE7_MYCFO|nr:hypothetical protein [Mycolicibacterium fortuitum]OMC51912.1 hypothetical protein A5742_17390 [Mycolicibacterium fortuitum]